MLLKDLNIKNVTRIYKNFYYKEYEHGYNLMFCLFDINGKIKQFEPIEFHTLLIELSTQTRQGNTYYGVASSFNFPEPLRLKALEIDRKIVKQIFKTE